MNAEGDTSNVNVDDTWKIVKRKIVKRCKKKLHQIAHLETIDRKLSPAEELKVNAKEEIRLKLQEVLNDKNVEDNSFNSNLHVGDNDTSNMDFITDDVNEVDTEQKPTSAKVKETNKKPHVKLRKNWKKKTFKVTELLGHNGNVCTLDIAGNWLITGSQDTSVKLWNLSTSEELRNLPGHTETVTCVKALDKAASNELYKSVSLESNEFYDLDEKSSKNERLLLTASVDCSIKLWLIPQGVLLKSIYNFSPVSALSHCHSIVFVGSNSGKLTAYNMSSGKQLCDTMIHNDKITTLKWNRNLLLSASYDGDLKLWEIPNFQNSIDKVEELNDVTLKLKYSLKNDGKYPGGRPIFAACFYKESIVFGDDGMNLKVVDVVNGVISKYPNHIGGTGFTDSLDVFNDVLLSSSYNPVNGVGSLNVRCTDDHSTMAYICSLSHHDIPRSLCCVTDKSHYIVTGGEKLLLWKRDPTSDTNLKESLENEQNILIKGKYVAELDKTDVSSDVESDESEIEEESDLWWRGKQAEKEQNSSEKDTFSNNHSNTNSSWWCAVV